MATTDDLSRFCCQNPDCPDYGQRNTGRLTVCGHYGKQARRRLYCKTCKYRFSERKGTPFFQSRLPDEQVVSLLHHIAEGCGVRKTGLFGVEGYMVPAVAAEPIGRIVEVAMFLLLGDEGLFFIELDLPCLGGKKPRGRRGLTGVDKDTVVRYSLRAGQHARQSINASCSPANNSPR